MKQLLNTFAFFFLAALCLTAKADDSITIKGHVKFSDKDFKVQIFQYSGTDKVILAETSVDSITNNYELKVPVTQPGQATVDCGHWQNVNVWLQDEDMNIDFRGVDTARVKIKNPPFVYINGGRKNEVMNLLNFESYRSYQSMIAIAQGCYKHV